VEEYFDGMILTRLWVQRGVAAIYFFAFLSAYNQFPALLGEKGLLPVQTFLSRISFRLAPSLFHFRYSDGFFKVVAATGVVLSLLAFTGLTERGPLWISLGVWLVLFVLYLSIMNVGQTFYGFGWESMLVEMGFITAFLGNATSEVSAIPILVLRWMLFRTEVGAGLIKLRHDQCWRDLTCLYYHYETQPLPNPLSWYFHRLPKLFHRLSVLSSHIIQLIVPFGLFAPQPIASICGCLIILHQLILIISGNYSWLNWLTVVLGFSAFSDQFLPDFFGQQIAPQASPLWFELLLYGFALLVMGLSLKPLKNLFSKNQLMNYSYNPLHLINAYGAFGSMTKIRYEVIVEGTTEQNLGPDTQWREYEFKAKPGPLDRRPPIIAPYHLRLDWLMWFLPFGVKVSSRGISHEGYERWYVQFIKNLLLGDKNTLALIRRSPFPDSPPCYIRARYFRYRYTDWQTKKKSGAWWRREYVGEYMPAISLEQLL
jgi:hypothetical protein